MMGADLVLITDESSVVRLVVAAKMVLQVLAPHVEPTEAALDAPKPFFARKKQLRSRLDERGEVLASREAVERKPKRRHFGELASGEQHERCTRPPSLAVSLACH